MPDLLSELISEKEYCRKLLQRYEAELRTLPEGSLSCEKTRGKWRFYERRQKKRVYLSAAKKEKVGLLARKRFLLKSCRQLSGNLLAIEKCIKSYSPYDITVLINDFPAPFAELLCEVSRNRQANSDANRQANSDVNGQANSDANRSLGNEVHDQPGRSTTYEAIWQAGQSGQNFLFPENLIHVTANGEKVRSKSEAIIAGLLYANQIPYKYEMLLELEQKTYYPDFTIRRPKDGKIFFWEHFGMIEDPDYAKAMERKTAEYRQNGILPWHNLLTSYDIDGSIDAQIIQNTITAFLL